MQSSQITPVIITSNYGIPSFIGHGSNRPDHDSFIRLGKESCHESEFSTKKSMLVSPGYSNLLLLNKQMFSCLLVALIWQLRLAQTAQLQKRE